MVKRLKVPQGYFHIWVYADAPTVGPKRFLNRVSIYQIYIKTKSNRCELGHKLLW